MAIQPEQLISTVETETPLTLVSDETRRAITEERQRREAKLADDRLYNKGVSDYTSGRRDTEAAQIFITYWKDRD